MLCTLPVRCDWNKSCALVSQPRRLSIVAVRVSAADRVETLLRDPEFIGSLPQAARHAALIADALAQRFGCATEAQVLCRDTGELLHSAAGGVQ